MTTKRRREKTFSEKLSTVFNRLTLVMYSVSIFMTLVCCIGVPVFTGFAIYYFIEFDFTKLVASIGLLFTFLTMPVILDK